MDEVLSCHLLLEAAALDDARFRKVVRSAWNSALLKNSYRTGEGGRRSQRLSTVDRGPLARMRDRKAELVRDYLSQLERTRFNFVNRDYLVPESDPRMEGTIPPNRLAPSRDT